MKKIFSIILAVAMLATMSVTAFAATNEGGDTSINVKGTYVAAQGAGEKISVDVVWDPMEFTYTAGAAGEWLPGEHKYADNAAGSWSTDTATITVTNHSNVAVTATLSFESTVSGVDGTFTETSGTENDNVLALDTAENTELAEAPKAAAEFGISGAAITETKDTLGTITVSIAKTAAKQNVTISLVDGAKVDYYYSDGEVDLATLVTNDAGLDMSYERIGGTGSGTITGSVLDFYINGTHIIEVTTAETDTYNAGSFTFTLTVTLDPGLEGGGPVDTNPGIDLPIDRN